MEIFISFITNYGLFLAKALTILIFLILVINAIAGTKKTKPKGFIQVKSLNSKFDDIERNVKKDLLDKKSFKLFLKQQKSKKQNNMFIWYNRKLEYIVCHRYELFIFK